MYKILLSMILSTLFFSGSSNEGVSGGDQDVFPHDVRPGIRVVLVANPTVKNIEIIRFLTGKGIFRVDPGKTRFVGVYHKNQAYDFTKSEAYLREHPDAGFSLYKISGDLPDSLLFGENACTADFRGLFDRSDGILFFGGPDIQPEIYGEENLGSVVTDPGRHSMEISFMFHLLGGSRNPEFRPFLEEKPRYLVTGFCLGMQTMNVATGGTLIQDIPSQVYGKKGPAETLETDRENLHRNYWQETVEDKQIMEINFHTLRFTGHPFFSRQIKAGRRSQPLIYSSHHQSPAKTGTGFEVTALSPDGKIIEGLAHVKYPHVFGAQFHPEVPALYEDRELWKFAPDDEPKSFHRMIGKRSVRFHRKYWRYISACLNN